MAEVDRSAATVALSAMQDEFPRARPVRSPPSGGARGLASTTTSSSASSSQSAALLDNKLSQEQQQSSSGRDAESKEKRERAVHAEDAGEAAPPQGGASGPTTHQCTSANELASGQGALEPPSTPAGGAAGSPPSDSAATSAVNTGRNKPDRGFKLDNFPGNDNRQRDQRGYSFGESRNSTRDMLLTPARDDMPFNMSPRS